MNYVGVDIRKKYSVLCALDETGSERGQSSLLTHHLILRRVKNVKSED